MKENSGRIPGFFAASILRIISSTHKGVRLENRKLLTVKELSELLGVPVSWIYQRTRMGQGAIPHVKFGKYVRFDSDAVIRFFAKDRGELNQAA